jgi:hypothetical protein
MSISTSSLEGKLVELCPNELNWRPKVQLWVKSENMRFECLNKLNMIITMFLSLAFDLLLLL